MSEQSKAKYHKALELIAEGRVERAIAVFEDILKSDPAHWDSYETLGRMLYRLGRLDEAIAITEKLVKLQPDHAMAHTNLSVFYMKKGLIPKAEEEKAKAVVLNFGKMKK